jgi:hypothetical protein
MGFELEVILFGIQNVELRGDRSHPLSVTLENRKGKTANFSLSIKNLQRNNNSKNKFRTILRRFSDQANYQEL